VTKNTHRLCRWVFHCHRVRAWQNMRGVWVAGGGTPRVLLPRRNMRTLFFVVSAYFQETYPISVHFLGRSFDYPKGPEIPKNGSPIPNKPHWRQDFAGANIRYFGLIMVYQGSNNPLTGAYLSLTCRYFALFPSFKRHWRLTLADPGRKSHQVGR